MECGHIQPTEDELRHLNATLDALIEEKEVIRRAAESVGWFGFAPVA
jgi:hypothetical protein